jgi:flagellar hook-associated protein 3 FlgL
LRADPFYSSSLANSIDLASSRAETLTSELSSGLRVSSLSDDPNAAAESTVMASTIAKQDTFIQTASAETSMLEVADSALGEVVSQLTTAVSLAVQGANGTLNPASQTALAQQLTGIRDQLLSLGNTSYQGQYLFGGSQGASAPFSLDSSTSPATVNYSGDTNVQSIRTASGQTIQLNLPGSTIFGSGSTGVFGALNQLITDLRGGASGTTLSADSSAITAALGQVSTQRSVLDSSLSRLQSAVTYTQTQEAQLKAQQSSLVAADPASVATDLKSSETQYEALLSVMSGLGKANLFDYLK